MSSTEIVSAKDVPRVINWPGISCSGTPIDAPRTDRIVHSTFIAKAIVKTIAKARERTSALDRWRREAIGKTPDMMPPIAGVSIREK